MRLGPAIAVACALLPACTSDDSQPNPQRPGIAPPPHLGEVQLPAPAQPKSPPGNASGADEFPPVAPLGPAEQPPSTAAKTEATDTAEEATPAERDLGQELVALLRPSACLDMQAGSFERGHLVSIQASAMAMPSGRLQDPSVQVAGQPASALACLAGQLLSGRLAGPIEGAPVRVQGTLQMEVQGAPSRTSASGG